MSDTIIRYGADTRDVVRAQKQMVRSTRQTASEVGRLGRNVDETFRTFVSAEAAKQAVMRSVSIAADAARQSDTLADNFARVTGSIDEFRGRLGDDLALTFFDDNGATAAGIDLLSKARDAASDFAAALLSGAVAWDRFGAAYQNARGVTEALRIQRGQEIDNRIRRASRISGVQAEAERLGLAGDTFGAQRKQIEADQLREQLEFNELRTRTLAAGGSGAGLASQQSAIFNRAIMRGQAVDRAEERLRERIGLEEDLARAIATRGEEDDRAAQRAIAVFSARTRAEDNARMLGGDPDARGAAAGALAGAAFDLDESRRAEQEAEQRERDRERQARERQRFEDRLDQARSRRLRATGQTEAADRLDAELAIRQTLADLAQSDLFTARERVDYERRLRDEVESRLSAEKELGRERDRFRTLGPGSSELAGAVFGSGGGGRSGGRDIARARRRRVRDDLLAASAVRRGDAVAIEAGPPPASGAVAQGGGFSQQQAQELVSSVRELVRRLETGVPLDLES